MKPFPVPDSVVGRLLATVSWEHATWYHAGGQGRENVLTAEVFQALDWLPRTAFLGRALLRARGATDAVRQLVREAEEIDFTFLPESLFLADGSSGERRRLWVQPDGLMNSPSVSCLVEAKRIKAGSFQAEQLAREYLAVVKHAEVVGKQALLLLVLPDEPPVRVSSRGGPTRRLTIHEAVEEPLESLLERVDPGLPGASDLLAGIDSTIAYLTWKDIEAAIHDARNGIDTGDASVDRSTRRVADAVLSAIGWHGHQPAAPMESDASPMSVAPMCMYCTRYHREDGRMGFRCDAFPDGIPEGIIANLLDHRLPIEGDRGLEWEQDPALPRIDHDFYDGLLSSGSTGDP